MNQSTNTENPTPLQQPTHKFSRPGFFMSQDLEWVKVVHNGKQIGVFHRNFFLKLLDLHFVHKARLLKAAS